MNNCFFKNIDKICTNRSFWGIVGFISIIVALILAIWLYDKGYKKTDFLEELLFDHKTSSILLVSMIGVYFNIVFILLFNRNSKDICELILTNCIFLTLIILDKFPLDKFKSIHEIHLTIVYYIMLTFFTCSFVGAITYNTWNTESFGEKIISGLLKYLIIYPFTVLNASLLVNMILLALAIEVRKWYKHIQKTTKDHKLQ